MQNKCQCHTICHPEHTICHPEHSEGSLIRQPVSTSTKWTLSAIMCYSRNGQCNGCYYDTFFESGHQCQMWRTVFKITGNHSFNRLNQSPPPLHCEKPPSPRQSVPKENYLLTYLILNNINIFRTCEIPAFIGSEQTIRKKIRSLIQSGHLKTLRISKRTYYKRCLQ